MNLEGEQQLNPKARADINEALERGGIDRLLKPNVVDDFNEALLRGTASYILPSINRDGNVHAVTIVRGILDYMYKEMISREEERGWGSLKKPSFEREPKDIDLSIMRLLERRFVVKMSPQRIRKDELDEIYGMEFV